MQTAYSGRAAAYHLRGDFDHAISDYGQSILRCLEFIRAQPDAPLVKFWCAREYRKRSLTYSRKGHFKTAKADEQKADQILAEAVAMAKVAKENWPAEKIKLEVAQSNKDARDL